MIHGPGSGLLYGLVLVLPTENSEITQMLNLLEHNVKYGDQMDLWLYNKPII